MFGVDSPPILFVSSPTLPFSIQGCHLLGPVSFTIFNFQGIAVPASVSCCLSFFPQLTFILLFPLPPIQSVEGWQKLKLFLDEGLLDQLQCDNKQRNETYTACLLFDASDLSHQHLV